MELELELATGERRWRGSVTVRTVCAARMFGCKISHVPDLVVDYNPTVRGGVVRRYLRG